MHNQFSIYNWIGYALSPLAHGFSSRKLARKGLKIVIAVIKVHEMRIYVGIFDFKFLLFDTRETNCATHNNVI